VVVTNGNAHLKAAFECNATVHFSMSSGCSGRLKHVSGCLVDHFLKHLVEHQ
jgi:hypothetical protein